MNEKRDKGAVGELSSAALCSLLPLGILKYEILEILSCGAFLNVFFFDIKKNVSHSCYKKTEFYTSNS